jgi:hypothetical protein
METNLELKLDNRIKTLLEEDRLLSGKVSSFEVAYSGLKDIDNSLKLASLKITIASELMRLMDHDERIRSVYFETVRGKAHEAFFIVEELLKLAHDEQDKKIITESKDYKDLREQISVFLVHGGGIFFESRINDRKKSSYISKIITEAIRRWTIPDDQYSSMPKRETIPPFLRSIIEIFLPWLARDEEEGEIGIEEGAEEDITSEKLKLPISQAAFYLENEVLPDLKTELEQSPGDPILQAQIQNVTEQVETLNKMKYFPRSIPVFPEKGFYTEGMTSYTAEGELVINVRIPTSYKSGTKLNRLMEMVKGEVARKLCGKGISKELDEEYAYLKNLESGIRGSSRTPSLKIDIEKAFSMLKFSVPALRQIENKDDFKKLIALVMTHSEKESREQIESLLRENIKGIE